MYAQDPNKIRTIIPLMCRFYGHGFPCLFQERGQKCKQMHTKRVKAAHDLVMERNKNNTPLLDEEVY